MKKMLSLLLIMTLVFSAGIPAFAAEDDSAALEKAITTARGIIEVPESFSDFNYSTSQTTINGKLHVYWNLSWNDLKQGGSISVTVDEDGNLTNYYRYENLGLEEQGLSNITKADGLKTAMGFLMRAVPGYGDKMRPVLNPDQTVYGQEFVYNFRLYVNDIPVDFAGASVSVNRFTGEISSYYYNGVISDLKLVNYPSVAGAIGASAAGTAYTEQIGVPLKYYGYYDYAKRTLKIFPIYEFSTYGKAIDAKTGKVVEIFSNDFGIYGGSDGMGKAESASQGTGSNFTAEELAAIESTQNLIKQDAAEEIARQLVPNAGKLQYISLEAHYVERDKYFWNMSFEKGYASVNAATSEVTSFSIYEERPYSGGGISKERALTIAQDFIMKMAPERFEQVKLVENQYNIYESESAYHHMTFARQVNDVEFANNSINVTVNKDTGKITSYYTEWYDSVKFPSIDGVIGEIAAFEKAAAIGDYGLIYKKISEEKVALVYDFINGSGMLIDANEGKRLNWDGTDYVSGIAYTDIKGSWAEAMILQLQENGYYLPALGDSKFNPKNVTTQIEFLRYLYSPIQSYYAENESFYNMLVTNGIIKKEEINADQNITRQDVAKFVVRYLGYDKVAQKNQIFKNFFRDVPATGYLGYATVCHAFDIITGDASGNFGGTRTINHAEVAKVIFKTLQAK